MVELAPDSGIWSHDRQTVTVQPTCTEDGYKVIKCGRCGKELGSHYSIVKALGHQFVETTVAPTCTESGYTVQKCSVCHEETGERTNLVAPLGHEYKNGVCIRCGAPEPQENGGSSSAAPNYTVTGAETYETSVVDGRYIIAVPSEDAALNAVLGDLRAIKHRVPMWWCSAPGAGSPALSSTRCWPWVPMLPPLCLPTTAARLSSPSTVQLITS